MQEIGVDELPVRLNEACKLRHKGSIVGRNETYAVLRIEEREKRPEVIDEESDTESERSLVVFDGPGNKYRLSKKILCGLKELSWAHACAHRCSASPPRSMRMHSCADITCTRTQTQHLHEPT